MVDLELDVRDHVSAIRAAAAGKLGPWSLYEYGEVPGDKNNPDEEQRGEALPDIYGLLVVERRFMPANRRNALASRSSWRASIRFVGRTVDEANWLDHRIATALNEQRLTVGGRTTTRLQHESTTTPEPDDGRFSGLVVYVYTH